MVNIDKEFKKLIPALTAEEFAGLEKLIIADGCRDALVTWQGLLIDGHNRYEICSKHDIEFKTIDKEFENRNDVICWIIDNQLSRRNISDYVKYELTKKKEEILKTKGKENMSANGGDKKSPLSIIDKPDIKKHNTQKTTDNDSVLHVVEELKAPHNTQKTIAKDLGWSTGKKAQADVVHKKASEDVKEKLRKNEISINKAYQEIKREEKSAKLEIKKQEILKESAHELKDNRPTIYNEDCLVFLNRFTECDLLITDPPYSTDIKDIKSFVDMWLYKALDKVKSTGRAYIFIGAYPKEVKAYLNAEIPKHMTLEQILIWEYKNTLGIAPKDRYILGYQDCLYFKGVDAPNLNCPITNEQWAVQSINAPDGRLGDRYHTWQKPLMLAERFIRHSTKKGDIVLDPFTCTGTFVIAANSLGRVGYGCDIDKTNLDIAVKRGCKLENI